VSYVDANPVPPELLGSVDCRPAAAEGVKDDIALVGRCGDNALKQSQRLLGRITEALLSLRVEGRNIRPDVRQRRSRHFIEVTLKSRHSGLGIDQASFIMVPLHSLFSPAQHPGEAIPFVGEIGPVLIRVKTVSQSIMTPSFVLDVGIMGLEIFIRVRGIGWMPRHVVAFGIAKQHVVRRRETRERMAFCVCTLPHDLINEVISPKHPVEQQLEVMARGGVAVQVEATGGLQHPVQLNHADRHHGQVSHHVVVAEKGAHRTEQLKRVGVAAPHDLIESLFGLVVPVPCVLECLDLRIAVVAVRRLEQDVVVGIRVEGRVEVDQVHALAGDMLAQHHQVVPVIKLVGVPHTARVSPRVPRGATEGQRNSVFSDVITASKSRRKVWL
jgi:hypothetical protein